MDTLDSSGQYSLSMAELSLMDVSSSTLTWTTHGEHGMANSSSGQATRKRKSIDDKKPRKYYTAYNYFVQFSRTQLKTQNPHIKISFADFSRECGLNWRNMSEQEKMPFQTLSQQDKARYLEEMKDYTPPESDSLNKKKIRRPKKDPNAPKKPLTSFNFFYHDSKSIIQLENPNWNSNEVSKEIARRWSQVEATIKQQYKTRADQDKMRYEQEMRNYQTGLESITLSTVTPDQDDANIETMEVVSGESHPYPWMSQMTETLQQLGLLL